MTVGGGGDIHVYPKFPEHGQHTFLRATFSGFRLVVLQNSVQLIFQKVFSAGIIPLFPVWLHLQHATILPHSIALTVTVHVPT